MGKKETLCSRCDKRNICKYADDFVELVSTTDKILTAGIHKIEVYCQEFMEPKVTIR